MRPLYVYWLRAPMLGNQVVYVGCGDNPEARRKAGQKRYNMALTVTKSKPYYDYDEAGRRETEEIGRHWPAVFNLVRKSAISAKFTERNAQIGVSLTGIVRSPETRAKISGARTGVSNGPRSAATRKKIGDGNRGKVVTEATRELIRQVTTGKKQSAETIAKRTAKTAGQKRTEEQRRRLSEAMTGKSWSPAMIAAKARQYEREQLLQSGYGRPWRIKNLSKETQEAIG